MSWIIVVSSELSEQSTLTLDGAGNLPFGITQEQVQQHFAKIRPTQVRLATEKDSKKSRGFAFVEFDNYDRMKTCLKLYHHSLLDDGKGNSRKINCELRYVLPHSIPMMSFWAVSNILL